MIRYWSKIILTNQQSKVASEIGIRSQSPTMCSFYVLTMHLRSTMQQCAPMSYIRSTCGQNCRQGFVRSGNSKMTTAPQLREHILAISNEINYLKFTNVRAAPRHCPASCDEIFLLSWISLCNAKPIEHMELRRAISVAYISHNILALSSI